MAVLVAGCSAGAIPVPVDDMPPDLLQAPEFGFEPLPDLESGQDLVPPLDPCAPDPQCHKVHYGLPGMFAMHSDPMRDLLVKDDGLVRDQSGALGMKTDARMYHVLWLPNPQDLGGAGTVSKVNAHEVREMARYLTVTCSSLPAGGTGPCDGMQGCCSIDDSERYAARKAHMAEPGHQAVQKTGNQPGRTTVDFRANLYIANRAYAGQASVTYIANDKSDCVDRNHNKVIDSSRDSNGDGWIEVDCNGDGVPDDMAGVQNKPCSNGLAQEFYGLDDECVLWTTNVFAPGAKAMAIGQGGNDGIPYPWVASSAGQLLRVDGNTGQIGADLALPGDCVMAGGPWGMVIDASGLGWVTEKGMGRLCWFDSRKAVETGVVRNPVWGRIVGDGLTMDRDQNVWVGGEVARYIPDRSNGLRNLSLGWWVRMDNLVGLGIAADGRNAKDYFVYSCGGANVVQIPASSIPRNGHSDVVIKNPGWPTINMPCTGVGIAWADNQSVWGVDGKLTTRAIVDRDGVITQPRVNGAPVGNNKCPAGDSCPNAGSEVYSDFEGYDFIYQRPIGTYAVLVRGCTDAGGNPTDTTWVSLAWDADVPPNTSLAVHARTANAGDFGDPRWNSRSWTPDETESPILLEATLSPNYLPGDPRGVLDGWLMVEFVFKTSVKDGTARLRSFDVGYRCPAP